MPRRPRGVYVRNTPDYFSRSGALVGVASGSTAGTFPSVALYNNSNNGQNLHVVGISIADLAANADVVATVQQGAPSYNVGNAGQSIYSGQSSPPGQAYFSNGVGGLPNPLFWLAGGGSGIASLPGWPLVVIPPTYALYLMGDVSNTFLKGTIWYVVLLD